MNCLTACSNCKKINCLDGEPLTTAWEGLEVKHTKDIRSLDYPTCETQNFINTVKVYSKDPFPLYNRTTEAYDHGRLLLIHKRDRKHYSFWDHYFFLSLDGFVYNC